MQVTYETDGHTGIIRVEGSMMVSDSDQFRQSFAQWFPGSDCTRVIVDMGRVDRLDSAGLGALVAAAQQARDKGGDLCFAALQKKPRMVFEITRSYKIFDIYASVEEARRAPR